MSTPELKRPGFGLPVNEKGPKDRFPNAIMDWAGTALTVRERTMLALMDSITDKVDWDRKVFDETITNKWRQEAFDSENGDVTEKMFDWITAELQDKARTFQKDGMTSVFDLDVAVVKSDQAIPPQLAEDLRTACLPLENVPPKFQDWHPGSDGKVLDLVHPSLFPLVYGRSKVLPAGLVGLRDCVEFIGNGETTQIPDTADVECKTYNGWSTVNTHFWSRDFQWLPCQVDFGAGEEIKISSYINSLHPIKYSSLYTAIEKCIAKTIPLWDRTLSSTRTSQEPRINEERSDYDYPKGRPVPDEFKPVDYSDPDYDEWGRQTEWEKSTRILIQPEPGKYRPFTQPAYTNVDLRNQFGSHGLQVIVKLANIELSPDKPNYEGGAWHIEGQLNERICASALYYYDSENITESFLAFRHRVDSDLEMKAYDQDDYEGIEELYAIEQDGPKIQELGRVLTREGRLLVFPNVLQHRVSPFRLQDPSKPGHRKILALFLVDPHIPILSTANVPPQQKAWWSERLRENRSLSMLPPELEDQIVGDVSGMPMSLEEAKEIRLKLMEERKMFVQNVDEDLQHLTFSFCEH